MNWIAEVAAAAVISAGITAGVAGVYIANYPAVDTLTVQAQPHEDEAGWDCRTMGNAICGPGNSTGVTPGQYEDGALTLTWDQLVVERGWTGDLALGA